MQKSAPPAGGFSNKATFWASFVAVLFGLLWFGGTAAPRREADGEMQVSKFGRLPILDGGRKKPVDTFARVHLFSIARRQDYYQEYYKTIKDDGKEFVREFSKKERRQATSWVLSLLADGHASTQAGVRVPPMLQGILFGQEKAMQGRQTFGPEEVLDAMKKNEAIQKLVMQKNLDQMKPDPNVEAAKVLQRLALEAIQKQEAFEAFVKAREAQGSPDDMRVFKIESDQVAVGTLQLERREGLRYTHEELKPHRRALAKLAFEARERPEKTRDLTDVKALELYSNLMTYTSLAHLDGGMQIVPPAQKDGKWKTLIAAIEDGDHEDGKNPAAASLVKIVDAYARNDAKTFNKELDAYTKYLGQSMPDVVARSGREAWFNGFSPFYQCLLLYVVVMLLGIASWVGWREPLSWAAFSLCTLVLAVHTLALVMRMSIMGRWGVFVTNLYSSAVFIGWGAVLLCLVACVMLWRRGGAFRYVNGIILATSGLLGFATMIVAHHLAGSGDTMEVMQAVLDTNFWLATHVTTVTLGYTATFVAGFLAAVYVFLMLATAVRSHFTNRDPYFVGPVTVKASFAAAGAAVLSLAALGVMLLVKSEYLFGVLALIVAAGMVVGGNALSNAWGLREWMRTHRESNLTAEHAGKDSAWFVFAVIGMAAIPGVLVTLLLGAMWLLLSDGETMDLTQALIVSIPALAVCGFYSAFVIGRRFSREYTQENAALPPVAHFVDKFALNSHTAKTLSWVIYGVVCFGMLLSFVGTVLGGIWADQSWGRFWGWDPKENGALLIVIMNALILHARFGGLVRERGVCVLAILGNMVTAWSWFGTNQLGVGLHAYGFNNTLAFGCAVFWVSQLGLAVLGLMPLRFWRAYADQPLEMALPASAKGKAPRGPRLQSGSSTGIQPA